MSTRHHYHFRSSIDSKRIDRRADELNFQTRSEYMRALIRLDIEQGLLESPSIK